MLKGSLLLIFMLFTILFVKRMVCYPGWCLPKLWEAHQWTLEITHTENSASITEAWKQISVDVIGNRFSSNEFGHRSGINYSIRHLYYYDQNTLFVIKNGKCTTTWVEGNVTQNCINIPDKDGVEYLKESLGDWQHQLVCGGLRTMDPHGHGSFHSFDVDSPPVPVIQEMQGTIHNVPTYTVSIYHNVTVGIKDPSVFTPPDICIRS